MIESGRTIDRRIIKSKRALKEALITLMKTKDFKEITVKDLVDTADVNRGTFYKHYHYKEDILEELMDDVIADLIVSYREPYRDIASFDPGQVNASTVQIFDHVLKYADFYSLIVHSNGLPGFQQKIFHVIRDLVLQDLIEHLPTGSINKKLLASYHAYAIIGLLMEWINEGFQHSSDYMVEQLLAIAAMKRGKAAI